MKKTTKLLALASAVAFMLSCAGASAPISTDKTNSQTTQATQTQTSADSKKGVISEELFEACFDGDLKTVMYLINTGLDIQAVDEGGFSYLMYAAYNGHDSIVHLLIEKGTDVNALNLDGRTALMLAATSESAATVNTLLKAGAEVNIVDKDEKFTALMYAATEGQIENVKILLAAGADPNLQDKDGDTAMSFAAASGHYQVVALLAPLTK